MPQNAEAIRIGARSPYSVLSAKTLTEDGLLQAALRMSQKFFVSTSNILMINMSLVNQMIDTHAPLELGLNGHLLVQDLMSVHLIRRKTGSVIISFHPSLDKPTTTAPYLFDRIRFAGKRWETPSNTEDNSSHLSQDNLFIGKISSRDPLTLPLCF